MTMTPSPTISLPTDPQGGRSLLQLFAWAAFLIFLGWAWQGAEIRPMDLFRDSANMVKYAKEFFPPDFRDWEIYLREMIITLHIAVWGTVLAIVCAVPFGLLSSSNIVPAWVYQPVRRLMDACRAINEMVFAMLFIVAVGLGPFAGVLALWIHTTGTLAKLFSEAVEAIDPRPVEGVRATGALAIEEIVYGVLPQVMPCCGFLIRCTALSPMCDRPLWWAWSVRAALAWSCTRSFGVFSTRKPARCC